MVLSFLSSSFVAIFDDDVGVVFEAVAMEMKFVNCF
jgi:hypothetical protein